MKYIGLACFHFGINFKTPFTYSCEQHIADIKSSLEKITSVSNIKVLSRPEFFGEAEINEEPTAFDDGGFFPPIQFLITQFSVYIPARVQEMILNETWAYETTKTENFNVCMVNEFYGPVTYIECVDPHGHCDPSYAVRVVRDYLEKEFEKFDSNIKFENIGPSPFHADIFLSENTSESDIVLDCSEKIRKGYNVIDFLYDKKRFDSEDDALSYFIKETATELSLFYNLKRKRIVLIRQWHEITDQIDEIKEKNCGLIEKLKINKSLRKHKLRNKLIGEIYQYKAENQINRLLIEESFRDTYENSDTSYFRKHIEHSLSELPDYPIDLLQEWLLHSDARVLKNLEISAILTSALLGGIVGSLITRLL